jgi:hypothetical protein
MLYVDTANQREQTTPNGSKVDSEGIASADNRWDGDRIAISDCASPLDYAPACIIAFLAPNAWELAHVAISAQYVREYRCQGRRFDFP